MAPGIDRRHKGSERFSGQSSNTPMNTLSTVVFKNKNAKIVVALMESGLKRRLKVVDIEPAVAFLGRNYEESLSLKDSHEVVLKNVESKENPVEELISKADEFIEEEQKPGEKSDSYKAMVHHLSGTWDELLSLLHRRRNILDKNANFQGHYQDFMRKAEILTNLCKTNRDKKHRKSPESMNETILELASGKKAMLETCVLALQDGELLSEELLNLWNKKFSSDARPNHFKESTSLAIEQVDTWLENLHSRRLEATKVYEERLGSLKVNSDYMDFSKEIQELETILDRRIRTVDNMELGRDLKESRARLEEIGVLKKEHDDALRDRIKSAVRNADRFSDLDKDEWGKKTSIRAYNLLERSAEYLQLLEARSNTLSKGVDYFTTVEDTKGIMKGFIKNQRNISKTDEKSAANDDEKVIESLNSHVENVRRLSQPVISSIRQDVYTIPAKKNKDEKEILRSLKDLESDYRDVLSGYRDTIRKKDTILRDRFRLRNEINEFLLSNSTVGKDYNSAEEFAARTKLFMNGIKPRIDQDPSSSSTSSAVVPFTSTEEEREFIKDLNVRLEQRCRLADKYLFFFNRLRDFETVMNHPVANPNRIKEAYMRLVEAERVNIRPELIIGQENAFLKGHMKKNIWEVMESYRNRRKRKSIRVDVEEREEYRVRYSLSPTPSEATTMTRVTRKYVRNLKDTIGDLRKYEEEISPPFIEGKRPEEILIRLREKAERLDKMRAPKFDDLKEEIKEFLSQVSMSDENKRKLRDIEDKMLEIENNYVLLEEKMEHSKIIVNLLVIFFKNFVDLYNSIHNAYNPSLTSSKQIVESQQDEGNILERIKIVKSFRDDVLNRISERDDPDYDRDLRILRSLFVGLERDMTEFRKIHEKNKKTRELTEREERILKLKEFRGRFKETDQRVKEASKTLMTKRRISGDFDVPALYTFESFTDGSFSSNFQDLERRVRELLKEDEKLSIEMPTEYAEMDLISLRESLIRRWNELRHLYEKSRDQIKSAKMYFALLEKAEKFVAISDEKIHRWKTQPPAKETLKEIRDYYERCKNEMVNDIMFRLMAEAGNVFGMEAAVDRVAPMQKRVNEILEELTRLMSEKTEKRPPEFEFPLTDTVDEKEEELSSILKAKIHRKPEESYEVQWFKDNSPVSPPNALRKSESSWLTRHLTSPDSSQSEWKVKVTSKTSGLSSESSLKVGPQIAPLWVKKPLSHVEVNEKENDGEGLDKKALKLECEVQGAPKPKVSWYIDGFPADTSRVLILDEEVPPGGGKNTRHSLTLPKNDHSRLIKKVEVKAKNPYGQINSSTSIVRLLSPPKFTLPLIDKEFEKEEKTLELKCQVSGTPRPSIYWFRDGEPFDYNKTNATSLYDGTEAILCVDPFLEGRYAIKAVNSAGEATSSAKISIEPPKKAPVILTHLKDQTIPEGCHSADLEVVILGKPKPELTWYKDDVPFNIPSSDQQLHDKEDRIHRKLSLKNLKTGGITKVRVKAVNEVGECESFCKLHLPKEEEKKPILQSKVVSEISSSKPTPAKKNEEFKPYGYDRFHTITKTEETVSPPKVDIFNRVIKVEEKKTLQLPPKIDHYQRYSKSEGRITPILRSPSPVYQSISKMEPREFSTFSPTERTRNFTKVEEKKTVDTLTRLSPIPKSTTEVKAAIANASTTEVHKPSLIPRLESLRKTPTESPKLPTDAPKSTSMSINSIHKSTMEERKSITEQKTLTSSMTNKNTYSSSERTRTLPSKTASSSLSFAHRNNTIEKSTVSSDYRPPKFILPLDETTVKQGGTAVFKTNLSGIPNPEISWCLNEEPLDKSLYVVRGYESVLTLNDVKPKQGGRISCMAVNPRGTAISTASLIVKARSPELIQGLDSSIRVKKGDKIFLEVILGVVEGDDEGDDTSLKYYDVQWTKNGSVIPTPADAGRIKTSRRDNVISLIIFRCNEKDSGVYEVKVKKPSAALSSSCKVEVLPDRSTPSRDSVTPTRTSYSSSISEGYKRLTVPGSTTNTSTTKITELRPRSFTPEPSNSWESHKSQTNITSSSTAIPTFKTVKKEVLQGGVQSHKSDITTSAVSARLAMGQPPKIFLQNENDKKESNANSDQKIEITEVEGDNEVIEEEYEDRIMYPSSVKSFIEKSTDSAVKDAFSLSSSPINTIEKNLITKDTKIISSSTTTYTITKSDFKSSDTTTESTAYVPPAWISSATISTNKPSASNSTSAINTPNSRSRHSSSEYKARKATPKYESFRSEYRP